MLVLQQVLSGYWTNGQSLGWLLGPLPLSWHNRNWGYLLQSCRQLLGHQWYAKEHQIRSSSECPRISALEVIHHDCPCPCVSCLFLYHYTDFVPVFLLWNFFLASQMTPLTLPMNSKSKKKHDFFNKEPHGKAENLIIVLITLLFNDLLYKATKEWKYFLLEENLFWLLVSSELQTAF